MVRVGILFLVGGAYAPNPGEWVKFIFTAVLGGVIVYIYTVIAYSMFRDDMILDNYPDEDIPMCTDLLVCFLNTFNEGLRGGDIGAIIDPSAPADGSFMFKLLYELTYYVIMITVMLNLIFGIIIDTFAQLRESNAATQHHMDNIVRRAPI